MRIQVISDYHAEFRNSLRDYFSAIPFRKDVELGICAGDLITFSQSGDRVLHAFKRVCDNYERLLYVPGNHEYYGCNREKVEDAIRQLESLIPNLTCLRTGEPFVFKGKRFLGDTMWFPNGPGVPSARRQINDFAQIYGLDTWCFKHSDLFLDYLKNNLKRGDIVVTHHLPSNLSTPPMFLGTPIQCFFVNTEAEQIFDLENKPGAWIHGHTHSKITYVHKEVQVICNPIGYPSENSHLPEAAEPSIYDV